MKISITFTVTAPDGLSASELDACLGLAAENFRTAMKPVGEVALTRRAGSVPKAVRVPLPGAYSRVRGKKRLELGDDDLDT